MLQQVFQKIEFYIENLKKITILFWPDFQQSITLKLLIQLKFLNQHLKADNL
jgi:hypothetical protein